MPRQWTPRVLLTHVKTQWNVLLHQGALNTWQSYKTTGSLCNLQTFLCLPKCSISMFHSQDVQKVLHLAYLFLLKSETEELKKWLSKDVPLPPYRRKGRGGITPTILDFGTRRSEWSVSYITNFVAQEPEGSSPHSNSSPPVPIPRQSNPIHPTSQSP
jgi:hypothetical protein